LIWVTISKFFPSLLIPFHFTLISPLALSYSHSLNSFNHSNFLNIYRFTLYYISIYSHATFILYYDIMFWLQVRWDDIVRVTHRIRGIVRFGARLFRHGIVLKRHFGGLREEGVFKLTLASTPKRCGTILDVPEQAPRVEG